MAAASFPTLGIAMTATLPTADTNWRVGRSVASCPPAVEPRRSAELEQAPTVAKTAGRCLTGMYPSLTLKEAGTRAYLRVAVWCRSVPNLQPRRLYCEKLQRPVYLSVADLAALVRSILTSAVPGTVAIADNSSSPAAGSLAVAEGNNYISLGTGSDHTAAGCFADMSIRT